MEFSMSEFMQDPIAYKDSKFREILKRNGETSATIESYQNLRDLFSKSITDEDFKMAPNLNSLTLTEIKDSRVYRIRCMTQYTVQDSEYFLSTYSPSVDKKITGFLTEGKDDHIGLNTNMELYRARLQSRRVFNCISIPAENWWYKSAAGESYVSFSPEQETCKEKAQLKEKFSNYPLKSMKRWSKSVLVKVYDETWDLPLNTMVEFIGVLFKEDEPVSMPEYEFHSDEEVEEEIYYPPFWIVPRLHAVSYRIIPAFEDISRLRPCGFKFDDSSLYICNLIREHVMVFLIPSCMGDILTAKYVLLNLMSKVHNWENNMSVGKLSINVYGSNVKDMIPKLYDVIQAFVPRSVFLESSKDDFNRLSIVPGRKPHDLIVKSAPLQLPSQTHLLVHDNVPASKLNPVGVSNQQALQRLASYQRLIYDIPYYMGEFKLDCPIIVLSALLSNIKTDVTIPLKPSPEILKHLPDFPPLSVLSSEMLKEGVKYCQEYFSAIKLCEISIAEDAEEEIQQDFVASRRLGKEKHLTEDEFSCLLTMARYIALSYGSKTITMNHYNEAKDMEYERRSRLINEE